MLGDGDEYTTLDRQWRYAQVADQIMSCLVKHGSNVEILDLGSPCFHYERSEVDENGHTWPEYSYRVGSVTTHIHGRQQFVKNIVIPIPVESGGTHL